MGNLARSGYGATEQGLWPYSYDTCDNAVLENQGLNNGLSTLPAQRLSCVLFEYQFLQLTYSYSQSMYMCDRAE